MKCRNNFRAIDSFRLVFQEVHMHRETVLQASHTRLLAFWPIAPNRPGVTESGFVRLCVITCFFSSAQSFDFVIPCPFLSLYFGSICLNPLSTWNTHLQPSFNFLADVLSCWSAKLPPAGKHPATWCCHRTASWQWSAISGLTSLMQRCLDCGRLEATGGFIYFFIFYFLTVCHSQTKISTNHCDKTLH